MNQCFLNVLDFPQVIAFVVLSIVKGADYQVFFAVAVLKHIEQQIFYHSSRESLLQLLTQERIEGFQVHNHKELFQRLEKFVEAIPVVQ